MTSLAGADGEFWAAGECDPASDAGTPRGASPVARVQILRERFGLATPLPHTTVTIPLERLVVPNEAQLVRRGRPFSVNLGLVGMLHPPAVVRLLGTDTFRVVTGRGRVIGARLLGEPAALECHRYERLTRTEESLLVLSENLRRAPAWVQEVEALARLITDGVGLTEADVGALLGLPISTVRERLKLASLPPALLAQLTRGDIRQELARRIARLNATERAALEERAEDGEEVTEALVKQALHGQIGAGMAPLRQALDTSWSPWERATSWDEAARAQGTPPPGPGIGSGTGQAPAATISVDPIHGAGAAQTVADRARDRAQADTAHDATAPLASAAGAADETARSLDEGSHTGGAVPATAGWNQADIMRRLITELGYLERMLLREPGTARACVLTQALTQELTVLLREVLRSTAAPDT